MVSVITSLFLTKEKGYTVVALRQWITRGEIAQGLVSNIKNWLKNGAFLLEYRNIQAEHLNKPISFGAIGSGYGLYAQNYISYAITNNAVYKKTNSSIHVTKSIKAGVNFTESARGVTIPSYRIKVTGIQSGQEMIYRGSRNTF